MKIKFFDNTQFQTFPITPDMIDIPDDTDLAEIGYTLQWDGKQLVPYKPKDNKKDKE